MGVRVAVGASVGDGVTVGMGAGATVGDGVTVGMGAGATVGDGVTVGVTTGVRVGSASASHPINDSARAEKPAANRTIRTQVRGFMTACFFSILSTTEVSSL